MKLAELAGAFEAYYGAKYRRPQIAAIIQYYTTYGSGLEYWCSNPERYLDHVYYEVIKKYSSRFKTVPDLATIIESEEAASRAYASERCRNISIQESEKKLLPESEEEKARQEQQEKLRSILAEKMREFTKHMVIRISRRRENERAEVDQESTEEERSWKG